MRTTHVTLSVSACLMLAGCGSEPICETPVREAMDTTAPQAEHYFEPAESARLAVEASEEVVEAVESVNQEPTKPEQLGDAHVPETDETAAEEDDGKILAIFDRHERPQYSPQIQYLQTQRAQAVQQVEYLRMYRQRYQRPRRGYGFGPAASAYSAGDAAARMAIAQDLDRLEAYIEQIDAAIERHRSQ